MLTFVDPRSHTLNRPTHNREGFKWDTSPQLFWVKYVYDIKQTATCTNGKKIIAHMSFQCFCSIVFTLNNPYTCIARICTLYLN